MVTLFKPLDGILPEVTLGFLVYIVEINVVTPKFDSGPEPEYFVEPLLDDLHSRVHSEGVKHATLGHYCSQWRNGHLLIWLPNDFVPPLVEEERQGLLRDKVGRPGQHHRVDGSLVLRLESVEVPLVVNHLRHHERSLELVSPDSVLRLLQVVKDHFQEG